MKDYKKLEDKRTVADGRVPTTPDDVDFFDRKSTRIALRVAAFLVVWAICYKFELLKPVTLRH